MLVVFYADKATGKTFPRHHFHHWHARLKHFNQTVRSSLLPFKWTMTLVSVLIFIYGVKPSAMLGRQDIGCAYTIPTGCGLISHIVIKIWPRNHLCSCPAIKLYMRWLRDKGRLTKLFIFHCIGDTKYIIGHCCCHCIVIVVVSLLLSLTLYQLHKPVQR